jgi:hypothetical protein
MKRHLIVLFAAVACAGLSGVVRADDAKSVTLKGTMECSKCELKETTACGNVLVVKDGAASTKYYLVDNDLSKGNHKAVCMAPKENVSVTGTVQDKDGKKWLTASKIDMPDDKGAAK